MCTTNAGVVLEHAALHEIARVLQEQEVIDGEAATGPTHPFLYPFRGCPDKVCERTVPTGSRLNDILGRSRG